MKRGIKEGMKKIIPSAKIMNILMKTGPYSPLKKGLSKYASICLLTIYKNDPVIDEAAMFRYFSRLQKKQRLFKKIDLVVVSNLRRARKTAEFIVENGLINNNVKIKKLGCLNEIKFSIKKICSQSEYNRYGSVIVRERFVEAFIKNELTESRKQIEKRCKKLDRLLSGEKKPQNILCVSHTFFLKI